MENPTLPAEIFEKASPEIWVYIAYLEVQLKYLEAKITELETRLNQNSRTGLGNKLVAGSGHSQAAGAGIG